MNEGTPLLTMVIKSTNDPITSINEQFTTLVNNLSMLCSFLSVDDFCSFIFSEKFIELNKQNIGFVFEIGIYSNHEKTLELICDNNEIILKDLLNQLCFEGDFINCRSKEDLQSSLNLWLSLIFDQ